MAAAQRNTTKRGVGKTRIKVKDSNNKRRNLNDLLISRRVIIADLRGGRVSVWTATGFRGDGEGYVRHGVAVLVDAAVAQVERGHAVAAGQAIVVVAVAAVAAIVFME